MATANLKLFGLDKETPLAITPLESTPAAEKDHASIGYLTENALSYRSVKGNQTTILLLAVPSSIIIGPQLVSPKSVGTPAKSIVWEVGNTLAAPLFAKQLSKMVSKVASPNSFEDTIVLGRSPQLDMGHFKNALTVVDDLVTLHGLWNPAHAPSFKRKITLGLTKWHKSPDGKPPDEWGWAGGRAVLGAGLSGMLDFLGALAQLIPLAVGGIKPIAAMATELYETYERDLMKECKNYEEALKNGEELATKFSEFTEPLAKDKEPLIISPDEALPEPKTFLDFFVLSKVKKGELGSGLAQLAKERLAEGAQALSNKYHIHLLMAEITKELRFREGEEEDDRLADACSQVEAEVEEVAKNRGGHVNHEDELHTQPLLEDISDESLPPTPKTSPLKRVAQKDKNKPEKTGEEKFQPPQKKEKR